MPTTSIPDDFHRSIMGHASAVYTYELPNVLAMQAVGTSGCTTATSSHSSSYHDPPRRRKANFTTIFLPYLTLQFNHEVTTRISLLQRAPLYHSRPKGGFDDHEFHYDGWDMCRKQRYYHGNTRLTITKKPIYDLGWGRQLLLGSVNSF